MTIGGAIELLLVEENKQEIVDRIIRKEKICDYESINEIFIKSFDKIYGCKRSPTGYVLILWSAVIVVYALLFIFRTVRLIFGYTIQTIPALSITLSIGIASVFALIGAYNSKYFLSLSHKIEKKARMFDHKTKNTGIILILYSVFFFIMTPLIGYIDTLNQWRLVGFGLFIIVVCLFAPLSGAFPLRVVPTTPINPREGKANAAISILSSGIGGVIWILSVNFAFDIVGYNGNTALVGGLTIGLTILIMPLFTGLLRRVSVVHPGRAMVTSVVFIIIFSGLFDGARISFQKDILTVGYGLLLFPLFNIFADTVSLYETRWILTRSKGLKVILLIPALVLDLFLSGLIYLILPILVGQEMNIMLQGVMFNGPDPWIGILFWSTFTTSAIYYLFFITIVTMSMIEIPSNILQRINKQISIEKNLRKSPIIFMSLVSLIISFVLIATYNTVVQPIIEIITWFTDRTGFYKCILPFIL